MKIYSSVLNMPFSVIVHFILSAVPNVRTPYFIYQHSFYNTNYILSKLTAANNGISCAPRRIPLLTF